MTLWWTALGVCDTNTLQWPSHSYQDLIQWSRHDVMTPRWTALGVCAPTPCSGHHTVIKTWYNDQDMIWVMTPRWTALGVCDTKTPCIGHHTAIKTWYNDQDIIWWLRDGLHLVFVKHFAVGITQWSSLRTMIKVWYDDSVMGCISCL